MSNGSNVVYVYDGSFEGLLTLIYIAFSRKEVPNHIFTFETETPTLYPTLEVDSSSIYAKKVQKWIRSISSEAYTTVYYSYLTNTRDKEIYILKLLINLSKEGAFHLSNLDNDDLLTLNKGIKHLKNEAHLLLGFIRFTEISGMLVAEITPKNTVLPIISKHFEMRFPNERFMIIDRTHKSILLHFNDTTEIFPYSEFELPPVPPNETIIENLWKTFYDTIAIDERENFRCRMGHMPKRYWENMTEMKDFITNQSVRTINDTPEKETLQEKSKS